MIEAGFVDSWKRNYETGNSGYLAFLIVLKGSEGNEWVIEKRYSEFLNFHSEV